MSNKLIDSLDMIATEKATKIIPENIKKGINILGIEGSLESNINVLDVSYNDTISIENNTLVIGGNV